MTHRTADELLAGIAAIDLAPRDTGRVEMIVRRPAVGEREVLETASLNDAEGVAGDSWNQRASKRTPDGSPHPDMQLNVMNARAVALIAGDRERWPLAGDQLYLDLDVSAENLPVGTVLVIGGGQGAEIVVTDQPHTGCAKFSERFGVDALRFVNSPEGTRVRARGINARVLRPGTIAVGDEVVVRRP